MDQTEQQIDERRIFDRVSARFPAKFKDTRDDFGTNVALRDASARGVKITTSEKLFMNDTVTIEVKLPDGLRPLNLRGQVVWIKQQDYNNCEVGLRFHEISLMHISRLYTHATGANWERPS